MKILLINNRHFYGGGTETVYFNTAELLRNAGHEVIFFSIRREENIACEQEPYFAEEGGKVRQLCNYFYNKDAAKQLERLIEAEKPDIAHVHLFWGGLSPSILVVLRKHNIPIIHTVHEYRMVCPAYLLKDGKGIQCERCKGGKFYQCTLHRCSKGSMTESLFMTLEMYCRNRKYHPVKMIDGFLFVSNFTRNKHIEFDPRFKEARSMVLYNFPSEDIKKSYNPDLVTFGSYYLFYGRLSVEKGVSTLIKAFERHPQLQLKIVGSGSLESDLKAYCEEKKLNNIEFLGFKTGKELFDLVANAKFVCVSSECYENNPMTIVEANSLRTPVIGANLGGIAEIVEDEQTGLKFESGSADSLSAALEKSHEMNIDSYRAMKDSAYQFAKKNFNREIYAEKLVALYKEVIAERKN